VGKDNVEFNTLEILDAFNRLVAKGNEVGSMCRMIASLPAISPDQNAVDDDYEAEWRSYILQAGTRLNGSTLELMVTCLENHKFLPPCTKQILEYTDRRKLVYFIVNLSLEGFE
jgi:hypothetical protein